MRKRDGGRTDKISSAEGRKSPEESIRRAIHKQTIRSLVLIICNVVVFLVRSLCSSPMGASALFPSPAATTVVALPPPPAADAPPPDAANVAMDMPPVPSEQKSV